MTVGNLKTFQRALWVCGRDEEAERMNLLLPGKKEPGSKLSLDWMNMISGEIDRCIKASIIWHKNGWSCKPFNIHDLRSFTPVSEMIVAAYIYEEYPDTRVSCLKVTCPDAMTALDSHDALRTPWSLVLRDGLYVPQVVEGAPLKAGKYRLRIKSGTFEFEAEEGQPYQDARLQAQRAVSRGEHTNIQKMRLH